MDLSKLCSHNDSQKNVIKSIWPKLFSLVNEEKKSKPQRVENFIEPLVRYMTQKKKKNHIPKSSINEVNSIDAILKGRNRKIVDIHNTFQHSYNV